MKSNSISDKAFVLSRVNFGETDRVLSVLCSDNGKLSVIAKGVRKGKSKLAGGIELFAENELVLLKSRSDLYIVTSSRMKNYFGNIAKDIDASAYAYECLKIINELTPDGAGEEYYQPLSNLMKALDEDKVPLIQIKIWFGLKVLENIGAHPNITHDYRGRGLSEENGFRYDFDNHGFSAEINGPYNFKHIKVLRHLSTVSKPVEIKTEETEIMDASEHLVKLLLQQHAD